MADERKGGLGESTVTIKWWGILVVILGIFGFFFTAVLSHEKRITTVEVQYQSIVTTLGKVETLTKEIRDDQIRRYELYEKNGKRPY